MEPHVQLSNRWCLLCRNPVCHPENAFAGISVYLRNLDILLTKIVLGTGLDYRGHTECFKFPVKSYRFEGVTALCDGEQKIWCLCRGNLLQHGPCPECQEFQLPCAFLVHLDCLKVLQTRMPKIRFSQIWHLGLWVNPIPGAPYYVSERSTPRFLIDGDEEYPETTELRSYLRSVNALPQEIIDVILANSDWPCRSEKPSISRIAFVLSWQPENLCKLETREAKSIRPQEIGSWFREHFKQDGPSDPKFFIIGLGSLGICAFRLLESRPTLSNTKFPKCMWYIIDKLSRLDDYIIRIYVGPLACCYIFIALTIWIGEIYSP